MTYDDYCGINREYRVQELISPPLWFEGYSIYRTAWCKKWVAMVILDPQFSQKDLSIDELYQSILYEWELHHYPNDALGIPVPNPPQLYQLEDAVKYFYYKQVVIEHIRPSTKYLSSSYPRRLLPQQQSIPPKRVNGVLSTISAVIRALTGDDSRY
jgi:hypothetical protein